MQDSPVPVLEVGERAVFSGGVNGASPCSQMPRPLCSKVGSIFNSKAKGPSCGGDLEKAAG